MRHSPSALLVAALVLLASPVVAQDAGTKPPDLASQARLTWVKRTPLAGGPVSPRLGYEGACVWNPSCKVMIRYGGHNQGGGGEQNSEIFTFDPVSAVWKLHEPNISPPGICCGQQNLYDRGTTRYLRFPAFSGSHGWQWWREIYLNDASVWTYDLGTNLWRNHRPLPTTRPRPLRCAAWDEHNQLAVLFGGEGSNEGTLVYDPHANTWTSMKPPSQPEGRSGGNMTYDVAGRQFVLFGSQFSDDKHTWIYDLRKNAWRDAQPPEQPPTDKNDAVLTYDPGNKLVLAVVKVSTGKDEEAVHRLETWTYDPAANRWTKPLEQSAEPTPSGSRARQLMFAPDLGLALLENRTHGKLGNEQQVWTFRAGPQASRFQSAPYQLQLASDEKSVRLTWKLDGVPPGQKYAIYRSEGERRWEAEPQRVATVEAAAATWRDADVKRGGIYHYRLQPENADPADLPNPSGVVRTQPRAIDDLAVTVLAADRVRLDWPVARPGEDVAGYVVERALVEVYSDDQLPRLKKQTPPLERPSVGALRRVGAFETLTAAPIRETTFTDTKLNLNEPKAVAGEPIYERKFEGSEFDGDGRAYPWAVYAYRVRAVSPLGVVSGPSSAEFTIPAAPEYVFAREDGLACDVKWKAPARVKDAALRYRVYRMDGRYDKDPVRRLVAEPQAELTFRDPDAGKAARRYHVVAVDVLGQEGFPSSPAWHQREWRTFYEPFVGEWHQ